jgi:hypothetical protein
MPEITRALLTASLLCAPLALAQPIAYVASVKPNDAVEARGFPSTLPAADSPPRQ